MNWSAKSIPTAEIEVPAPEVYWMERFEGWEKLRFQMGLLRSEDKIVLINTGFPHDVAPLAKAWREFLGERADLHRPDSWRTEQLLADEGISPDMVTHVIITPIQIYATGNLHLFRNAKICISRQGWIEDVIAPTYPHHVPRQGCLSDEHLSWLLNENHENLCLLEDTEEVLPGLTCRWVGTHHRSSMLVEVETEQGKVMFSDCAFHYRNVEEGVPLGIAESIIEAHAAYDYIRREAAVFVPLYEPDVQTRHPGGVIA